MADHSPEAITELMSEADTCPLAKTPMDDDPMDSAMAFEFNTDDSSHYWYLGELTSDEKLYIANICDPAYYQNSGFAEIRCPKCPTGFIRYTFTKCDCYH
jgi:hypothetical protein